RVRGFEMPVEKATVKRERQSEAEHLAPRRKALEVIGPVPRHPPRPFRRREQTALLVEANGVAREVGAPGQLLHPPLPGGLLRGLLGHLGRHAPDSRSVHSQGPHRPRLDTNSWARNLTWGPVFGTNSWCKHRSPGRP